MTVLQYLVSAATSVGCIIGIFISIGFIIFLNYKCEMLIKPLTMPYLKAENLLPLDEEKLKCLELNDKLYLVSDTISSETGEEEIVFESSHPFYSVYGMLISIFISGEHYSVSALCRRISSCFHKLFH